MFPETLSDLQHRAKPKPTQSVWNRPRGAKAQSLVELALCLPLMLFLLLAIAEVGNMIRILVAVEAAAREAARAGSIGAPDYEGSRTVATTAADVLQRSVNNSDVTNTQVWVMRPLVKGSQGAYVFEEANWVCGFGEVDGTPTGGLGGCTAGGTMPSSANFSNTDLLTQVNDTTGDPTPVDFDEPTDGTRFIVVVVYHEAQTLTNTSLFNLFDQQVPIRAYTVLRQEVSSDAIDRLSNECPVFPLALIEPNFAATQAGSTSTGQIIPGETIQVAAVPTAGMTSDDEVMFLAWQSGGVNNDAALATSLTPPGNSTDDTVGYMDPGGGTDTLLQIGDPVFTYEGVVSPDGSTYDTLVTLQQQNRQIRVPIVGDTGSSTSNTVDIAGFGIIKISDVVTQTDGTRTGDFFIEFIRYETGCGAEDTES